MYNRVFFHNAGMPYANMDGYERVIAFKTSPAADVAMGQDCPFAAPPASSSQC